MKTPKFRTRFDGSADHALSFKDVQSATDQQFKKDCDINEMLKQYHILGTLSTRPAPQFGDFASCADYMANLERVRDARAMFDGLSAHDRARFDGSFERFLASAADPKNAALFVELGLVDGKIIKADVTAPAAKQSTDASVGTTTT